MTAHARDVPCPGARANTLMPSAQAALFNTPAPVDPLLGTQIGNFRLKQRLGSGGMGVVYLGEHPAIGSNVAIKLLHPLLAQDPQAVRRFYAEARAANVVAHEGIVRVLDLGHAVDLGFYLVMEYVAGRTLAARLRDGLPDLAYTEAILGQLCAALGAAHAQGVVHRDLKPDNILLVERDDSVRVKITDFGIAKLRADSSLGGTRLGDVIGTPEYMAPEQCEGSPADARADLYALGVLAYEMVTGQRPFEGTPGQLLVAHLNKAPRPPRELAPNLPEAWNAAISRALSKSPDERFSDAASFTAALRARPKAVPAPSRGISAEVTVALAVGVPPVIVQARDLSRSGALLAYAGTLPPLFTRVRVNLGHGAAKIELAAEVVRHVTADDARAWKSEPGFAVQFRDAPPLERALASAAARPPTPVTASALPRAAQLRLEHFAARLAGSPYDVLELPLDAPPADVLERGKRAMAELRDIEAQPLAPLELDKLQAALARVASAIATLGAPRARLRYDASHGNPEGIAAALRGGLAPVLLEEEHLRACAANPGLTTRTALHLARVKLARSRGNREAAVSELSSALLNDPLNPALHQLMAELKGPR